MSFAGQEKAVLTVFRGASHFNFHFFQYQSFFQYRLNTKMTAEELFFVRRLAHTFAAVSR